MSEEKKFKFDVVIGNPPYQEETIGDNKTFSPPIYHKFLEEAYDIGNIVEMIHPGRFLFNAGSTPKAWNEKMLNDPHVKVIYYELISGKVFPNTDIKGGVAVTYRDINKEYKPIGTFIAFEELKYILKKVTNSNFKTFSDLVYSPESYKLTPKLHEDYPNVESILSDGHKFSVATNIFEKLPFLFFDEVDDKENYIQIHGRENKKRVTKYVKKEYIEGPENFSTYKVFVPKSNGSGALGETLSTPLLGTPLLGTPLLGHTQTFLSIGKFDEKFEAEACLKYIKTKFARCMLGILKVTQDNKKKTWKYVPLQDFTENSDIDWSKTIHEIDLQLYKKYGLSEEEIDFIETHVEEMD